MIRYSIQSTSFRLGIDSVITNEEAIKLVQKLKNERRRGKEIQRRLFTDNVGLLRLPLI
jgi:hypothetical protein